MVTRYLPDKCRVLYVGFCLCPAADVAGSCNTDDDDYDDDINDEVTYQSVCCYLTMILVTL